MTDTRIEIRTRGGSGFVIEGRVEYPQGGATRGLVVTVIGRLVERNGTYHTEKIDPPQPIHLTIPIDNLAWLTEGEPVADEALLPL